MPCIDLYSFGKITIDGKKYTKDVIILPDGVRPDWWRKNGHSLHPDDLKDVVTQIPEIFIMGCGAYGVLKVPDATREWIAQKGIEFESYSTKEACERYNELCLSRRVAAGLHLTC